MKTTLKYFLVAIFSFNAFAFGAAREIELRVEKKGDVIHWEPETIEVTQGEEIKFTAHYDLKGGADFHGFLIPALKITKQVNRNQPLVVETKIPSDLKPGPYTIGCQFHPKHARLC